MIKKYFLIFQFILYYLITYVYYMFFPCKVINEPIKKKIINKYNDL